MAQIAQRPAKEIAPSGGSGASMAQDHEFPVLFTIDGTNRHEVILVNSGVDLKYLKQTVEALLESPNCAEVLSKYRSKEQADSVAEINVKWSSEGRDRFPAQTLLTEANVQPVLRMMAVNVGKDIFDVKLARKSVGGDSTKSGAEAQKQ